MESEPCSADVVRLMNNTFEGRRGHKLLLETYFLNLAVATLVLMLFPQDALARPFSRCESDIVCILGVYAVILIRLTFIIMIVFAVLRFWKTATTFFVISLILLALPFCSRLLRAYYPCVWSGGILYNTYAMPGWKPDPTKSASEELESYKCFPVSVDKGKSCKDSSECLGHCLPKNPIPEDSLKPTVGECSSWGMKKLPEFGDNCPSVEGGYLNYCYND